MRKEEYIMKATFRSAFLLFFVLTLVATASGTAWAGCSEGNIGVAIGTNDLFQDFKWTFSLINLTSSNIKTGAKGSTEPDDHTLGSNFPYNTVYPPGNSTNSKSKGVTSTTTTLNLTTWKSNSHNKMFPDHCTATVPIEISSDTSYNFSLRFQQSDGSPQRSVRATLQPPYGQTTWKYSTKTSNDNGYYSSAPVPSDNFEGDGILFAISDKYVLAVYKNHDVDNQKGGDLVLVVTERNPKFDYHGNKVQWSF